MGCQNILSGWYLIYTKARQEDLAKQHLERQGYEIYFPRIKQLRKRRAKVRSLVEAAFPRYLFIRLTTGVDDWSPIRSTIGVSNLVKFGNLPAKVPDCLVDTLKHREDDEGFHQSNEFQLKKGDHVVITDGLFSGYDAIFTARNGFDRVVVLLNIMGQYTRANIAYSDLELSY